MNYAEKRMNEILNFGCYENAVLTPIDMGRYEAYYLGASGIRTNSTLIIFSPEGIILCGDLCPGKDNYGVISSVGYGPTWFSEPKSLGYLAEKFRVPQVWSAEIAAKYFDHDNHRDGLTEDQLEDFNDVVDDLKNGRIESDRDMYDRLDGIVDLCDGIPGYQPDPDMLGHIAAINRKFAELYQPPVNKRKITKNMADTFALIMAEIPKAMSGINWHLEEVIEKPELTGYTKQDCESDLFEYELIDQMGDGDYGFYGNVLFPIGDDRYIKVSFYE